MLEFLEWYLNKLGMTLEMCTLDDIEQTINNNLNYFRMKLLEFYFDGVENISDVINCTVEDINENFNVRPEHEIGEKEIYYMGCQPLVFTIGDRKLIESARIHKQSNNQNPLQTISIESTPIFSASP